MNKFIKIGNILDVGKGVIVHGCNGHGIMGAGLAVQIKNKWPACFQSYSTFCKSAPVRQDILGSVVPFAVPGKDLVIANCITQLDFGRDKKKYVSYAAIDRAFREVADMADRLACDVHYPAIGAGLGGGDWSIISEIIDGAFSKHPHIIRTLWIYE